MLMALNAGQMSIFDAYQKLEGSRVCAGTRELLRTLLLLFMVHQLTVVCRVLGQGHERISD